MLDFKENFFFLRFAILFFIIIVFGYWGVDLNSEEIYIAFTFLFLTVASFVVIRKGLLLFFVKAVNNKYARLIGDLLLIVGALKVQSNILDSFSQYLPSFSRQVVLYTNYLTNFLRRDFFIFRAKHFSKLNYLRAICCSSTILFAARLTKTKVSLSFFGKLFDISL